ncbi:MAG: hypothetical protein QNL04_13680 [SAR324 cluster bacterium]|nr:hypothetical protein [SAR324 cluster bacterium]
MKVSYFVFFVLLFGLWATPAMAYIDPGSGSAIMSGIIGFFVALGLVIKTYWFKIKSLFTGGGDTPADTKAPEKDDEQS